MIPKELQNMKPLKGNERFERDSEYMGADDIDPGCEPILTIKNFGGRDDVVVSYCCNVAQPLVKVRKKQIIRAFVNLISNAVQAVEQTPGGKVRISVDEADKGEYSISIADNGPGVSPENRSKLFKPNFTTKTSGTGLGLAITRSIVEQSSGRIFYRTSDMGGADFVIVLPKLLG